MRLIKTFFCLIAGYLLFGVVACLLPDKPVQRHIKQTVDRQEIDRDYPRAIFSGHHAMMDNFTDALIISQVWNSSSDSIWESVMQPSRAKYCEEMTTTLKAQIEGHHTENVKYGRYWHGSTFLMRYLLLIWSYESIRLVFGIVTSLLLLFTLVRIKERIGSWAAFYFIIAACFVYLFITQFSIQFVPVLVLSLTGMLVMLDERRDPLLSCFVIGSLTAYFDLLTTPLLTIGRPLTVWVLAHRDDGSKLLQSLTEMLKMGVVWGIGFAATWGSKWILATLTTDSNIWADAMENIAIRSGDTADYTRFDALTVNLDMLSFRLIVLAAIVMTVLMAIHFRREGWKPALLLLLIATVPYLWYIVVANHSYVHFWFTYRLQFISILALFAAAGCMTDWNKLKNKN